MRSRHPRRNYVRGSTYVLSFPSGRCSASRPAPPVDGIGPARPPAQRYGELRPTPVSAGASPRTSSGTLTRSRWRAKAYRGWAAPVDVEPISPVSGPRGADTRPPLGRATGCAYDGAIARGLRSTVADRRCARRTSKLTFQAQGGVMTELLLDAAGRRRSPATMPAVPLVVRSGRAGLDGRDARPCLNAKRRVCPLDARSTGISSHGSCGTPGSRITSGAGLCRQSAGKRFPPRDGLGAR